MIVFCKLGVLEFITASLSHYQEWDNYAVGMSPERTPLFSTITQHLDSFHRRLYQFVASGSGQCGISGMVP